MPEVQTNDKNELLKLIKLIREVITPTLDQCFVESSSIVAFSITLDDGSILRLDRDARIAAIEASKAKQN